ncbi:MAG: DUF924 domain-containing protein [Proteobacteria bacterium]|nr:DUF924 domain-containing protein [Pseudomonadota bacterium]MDA1059097.1 DUF924 domain-containing protein [Pseudomonadota bacterium]
MTDKVVEDVLEFWFSDRDESGEAIFRKAWFEKDPAFDRSIRERFEAPYRQAAARPLDDWRAKPRSALALTLILDQFSRNMFRDDPAMYAADDYAVEIARGAIERRQHDDFPLIQKWFFFMPLMHSEKLADQETCLSLFQALSDGDDVTRGREAAQQHRDIVARFGRFPHRNKILDRITTAEEAAFLLEPNSSF